MPSRQDVEEIRRYDFHIEYKANLRAVRDPGRRTQKLFGNPLVNRLFPLKWRGPDNDPGYQQWLQEYWQGSPDAEPVLGVSTYRYNGGGGGGSWGGPPSGGK